MCIRDSCNVQKRRFIISLGSRNLFSSPKKLRSNYCVLARKVSYTHLPTHTSELSRTPNAGIAVTPGKADVPSSVLGTKERNRKRTGCYYLCAYSTRYQREKQRTDRVLLCMCVIVGDLSNALRRLHVDYGSRKNVHAYTCVLNPWVCQRIVPSRHMLFFP